MTKTAAAIVGALIGLILPMQLAFADGGAVPGPLSGSSQNPLRLLSHRRTSSVQMRALQDNRFRRGSIRHL
jgi:hypothetical protein